VDGKKEGGGGGFGNGEINYVEGGEGRGRWGECGEEVEGGEWGRGGKYGGDDGRRNQRGGGDTGKGIAGGRRGG